MLSILDRTQYVYQISVLLEVKSRENDYESEKHRGYIFRLSRTCIEQHKSLNAVPHIPYHPITYSALSSLQKMSVTACEWMVAISASFSLRNATCEFACILNTMAD